MVDGHTGRVHQPAEHHSIGRLADCLSGLGARCGNRNVGVGRHPSHSDVAAYGRDSARLSPDRTNASCHCGVQRWLGSTGNMAALENRVCPPLIIDPLDRLHPAHRGREQIRGFSTTGWWRIGQVAVRFPSSVGQDHLYISEWTRGANDFLLSAVELGDMALWPGKSASDSSPVTSGVVSRIDVVQPILLRTPLADRRLGRGPARRSVRGACHHRSGETSGGPAVTTTILSGTKCRRAASRTSSSVKEFTMSGKRSR